jgi:hypothetical protein
VGDGVMKSDDDSEITVSFLLFKITAKGKVAVRSVAKPVGVMIIAVAFLMLALAVAQLPSLRLSPFFGPVSSTISNYK